MTKSQLALLFALLLPGVLVFSERINAQTSSGKLIFSDELSRLLLINADGTGQTILTTGGTIQDSNPAYSPDGSKIAFDRYILGKTHIFIMNADGTNPVAVTSDGPLPNTNSNTDPTWSPDGTKLAFVSDRSDQRRKEIWVVNIDGSGLIKLTTNVQLTTDGQGPIYSADLEPSWSPDGTRIAFTSSRDGLSDTELYVMNVDGSNQTRLTDNANDDRYSTWSPDSQRIAFYRNGGTGNGINIMSRDGANVVNVTNSGFMPAWSPDGARFAFAQLDPSNNYNPAIFISNVDGTNPVKITNNTFDCWSPAWAPTSSPPIPTSTISGHVLDGSGTPVNGAAINLTGLFNRSTQSDAAGAYSFAGLPAGNYRIDIAKSGFGFVPASVDFTNLTANQTANFTAFVSFSISGQVSGLGGNSIFVSLSGSQSRSGLTDFNGHYSFNILPAGGNYTVAISTPFWNISPNSVSFNNLSANQIANFDAVRATYSISGRITRLGNPKPGITVRLEDTSGSTPPTTITDVNGQYSFAGVRAGGTYFVRPVGANYLMQPQTRDFSPLDGNKTADFVALSANHLILSNASFTVGEGRCTLQVTVFRGGNAAGVGPITVDYATTNGTATAGSDYTAVSGTLSFPEGTFSRTITIPILEDQLIEGSEQFAISLSNSTGEVDLGIPSSATVTITDNDPTATPILVTETNSDRAIALNATSFSAGPFRLTTPLNFSLDTRTRISFFVENLEFNSCQGLSVITVDAEDAQQNHFQLPLEAVLKLPGNNPFGQLIVRLPEGLSSGDLLITISTQGQVSNKARISIQP
jgi:Tol biopolymer transport system component